MRPAVPAILLLLAAVAAAAFVLLGDDPAQDLLVEDAHAAPLTGRPGEAAVFLTLSNAGPPDRLVGVSSAEAASARIVSPDAPGVLPLPGDGAISLAADGAHVRLTGVEGLGPGRLIPLTLVFERAGEVSASARVSDSMAVGEAADLGLTGIGGICRVGEGEPAPAISLSAAPLPEGGWRVTVSAQDFDFRRDLVDGPHQPGTGHGHLYVDGAKITRLYAAEADVGPLPPGPHLIRVTLNTNDHRAYVTPDGPVSATLEIEAPKD